MNVSSDNMYKCLKRNYTKDGLVNRVYENEYVKLMCSTPEIDLTKNKGLSDEKAKWNCTFITSEGVTECSLFWDSMAAKFERLTLDKKTAEPELF